MLVAAVWLPDPSLVLFLAGGVLAGAGAGMLFKGVHRDRCDARRPGASGGGAGGIFLAGYLGLAVPVIGLGVLAQFVAPKVALLAFAALLLAGALLSAAAPRRALRAGAVGGLKPPPYGGKLPIAKVPAVTSRSARHGVFRHCRPLSAGAGPSPRSRCGSRSAAPG